MFAIDFLITYLSSVSYLLIFLLFLATGLGLPIPEELTLLVIGYLASYDILELIPVMITSFFAVFLSDNLGFFIGKYNQPFIQRFIPKDTFNLAKKHMHAHGKKTIFLTRFVCGLRVLFPIVAGSVGIPWKTFILIDTSAIILLVPTFILLGYFFGPSIGHIGKIIITLDRIILISLALLIIFAFFFYRKLQTK